MELVVGLVVVDHKHKRVIVTRRAVRICPPAQRDGERIGRLVNRLIRSANQPRQIPRQALDVRLATMQRQIFAHAPIRIELRKRPSRGYVKVHIGHALGVPKEEPVLLHDTVRRLPLQLCAGAVREEKRLAGGRRAAHVACPVGHEAAEILDPLAKAGEAAVAAVHDKGGPGPVKDAGVVGPVADGDKGEVVGALAGVGDGGGGLDGEGCWFANVAAVGVDAGQCVVDEFGVAD